MSFAPVVPHDPATCELCAAAGGTIVFQHPQWRVVLVDDALYPGFCRVVWHAHVKEMTDLDPASRALFMRAVWQVEAAVRTVLQPEKINLASLGNLTAHLHWHVIPRFADDANFPQPIWGQQQRAPSVAVLAARAMLLPALCAAIVEHCAAA